jgi:diacylglycerol kinase family enzyme
MPSSILLINNPYAGNKTSTTFVNETALPLLKANGLEPLVRETEAPGHAGVLAKEFVQSLGKEVDRVTLIAAGGDGTVHEIVNVLGSDYLRGTLPLIEIVILPCGTANASYSTTFPPSDKTIKHPLLPPDSSQENATKLQSLLSYLSKGKTRPLAIARTQFWSPDGKTVSQEILSIVVTSTALHAAILSTAEELRASHPGVERFKVAAEQNIKKWYHGRIQLLPEPNGEVKVYDPKKKELVAAKSGEIAGPFVYFLSTINVDRLEPTFITTPLATKVPSHTTMDIVMVRPTRDPHCLGDTAEGRERFASRMMNVWSGAYGGGKHLDIKYLKDGTIGEGDDDDTTVVEYYRCGGWIWTPEEDDSAAQNICADGTILGIEKGGFAKCSVLPQVDGGAGGFRVWA